jgi:hypothetical protein
MKNSSRPAYLEAHSALNWSLLTRGLLAPVAAEIALVILGAAANPQWFIPVALLPLFVPVMIYVSLLYRNWPTGIRIDEPAISIGAIRSPRAARRTPTVNFHLHQPVGRQLQGRAHFPPYPAEAEPDMDRADPQSRNPQQSP